MKLFFDTNKRTMPQQVKKNKEDIEAQHEIDVEIDEKIDKEIQDRTDADIGLQALIQALKDQVDALGNVLTFKGSVATTADLPATNNHVGDVYFVISEQAGYVWIDDDGTERWELLGLNIDLSAYATKLEVETGLAGKQDTLTAGTNISIIDNVISAAGGSSDDFITLDTTAQEFTGIKELKFKDVGYLQLKNYLLAENITFTPHDAQIIMVRKINDFFSLKYNNSKWYFRVNNTHDIEIPQKAGTMALLSDIPTSITKTYGSGFSQSGGLTVERDIIAPSATSGNYLHHILLKYVSTYQWTINVNFEIIVETNSNSAFTTATFASWLNTNNCSSNDASHTYKIPSFIIPSTSNVADNCFANGLYSSDGTSISVWYCHNYYNLSLS